MKNSTFSAQVANKLLTVLQGYTKGIRFVAVLTLLFTLSVGSVLGAEVTFTAGTDKGTTTNTSADSMTKSGITISSTSAGLAYAQYRFYNGTITISSTVGNISKIVFTCTSTDYASVLGESTASVGSLSINSSTVTWTGSSSSFTIKNTAQTRVSKIVVTTADSYTVTWTINPAAGGTLSATSGTSTTVTPNVAYTYGSPACTVTPAGKANVSQDGDKFTATPSADCTIQINMVEKTPATISFENMGAPAPITTGYYVGDTYTLPDENDFKCGDKTFVGWSTVAIANADTKPTADTYYEPGESVTLEADNTFYAVFATEKEGDGSGVETTITIPNAILIGSLTSSYANKSFVCDGYTFNLNACVQSSYCQMRDNNTISFIQIPTLPGPITKISCTDCKNASGSAYSGTLHFKSSKTRGNSDTDDIAKVTYSSVNSFEWEIDNETHKTGYLLTSAGLRLKNLSITYTSGSSTTYSDYTTTCTTCTPPTSVTVTPTNDNGWRYSIGETISLTATAEGGTGDYTYQWQKFIESAWEDIDGATSQVYTKENCGTGDGGSYRCVVSTGTDCSTTSEGYFIRIFTLNGNYYGEDWTENKIVWSSANQGVATVHLEASRTYLFKVTDNDGKWFGYGDVSNYIVQPWQADCGTETGNGTNANIRLFTGPEGDYTFTINIEHSQDNSPYVNIDVAYPEVEHPVEGYGYITKWWNECYIHWWDNNNNALTAWGSDAQITTYTTICETEYYFFPIIDNYINLIIKDKAGNPSNTTGDQTQTGHSGWYITHDGSSWGWHEFATYTITFAANGGTGSMDPINGICPTTNKTLTTNQFEKTGYTFAGWKADKNVTINGNSVAAGTLITDGATIQNITSDITLTAQWQVNSYALTWNLNGGTVTKAGTCAAVGATGSPSGSVAYGTTITAPGVTREGYRFDGWHNGTAIVEPETTMGTSALIYTAQWTKVYTVTFYSNGSAYGESQTLESGNTVTFPTTDPTSCDTDHYPHFIGWTTNPIDGSTTTQPELVTSATVSNVNLEFHAVFAAGTPGTTSTKVDVLNRELTGVPDQTGTTVEYTDWSDKTATSSAVYAGQSAGGNDAIQLRSSNSNSGIITTASGGKATKVVVSWNNSTTSGRTLNVYGKNSAYTAATDLYGDNLGTLLGTIVEGTSTELTITDDYEYIGLRSASGAMYLDEIQITWSAGSAANYTSFITSCCDATANLVLTPNPASPIALDIDGNASTTISFATENGEEALYYRPTITPSENTSLTINGTWSNYTGSAGSYTYNFTATGTYTIKQEFKQNGYECKKSASTTITVAANPILQVSKPTITSECGTEGTPVAVTIDSRYLKGSSLTAKVATTTDTEHGVFKICTTEDGDFATTDLTGLSAGKDDKATVTIYVRYDAALDNIDAAEGTLTITDGTTSQTVDLTTTPTCGTSIRMTPTDANSVRVTTANGQWTRTQTAIHLRGSYLLQNLTGDQGAKVELTSSNSNFKFVKPDVASSGTVKYESEKITDNTWEADVYLVYTPTAYDANETTTITAKVITFGGTTEHATATLTAYGRSFPETFVLALYTGSEWVALPADMIAPYGGCTTGVGTHDPYPITVNDNDNPTTATLAPARAVYKGAARNTPTTNPWTIQFESNTQNGYYLFGSNNANTTIANTNQATGEGVKWALTTEDNITYQLSQTTATNGQKLGYNATAKYMGQYQSTATNFKYDFRILPVTSTCTYYIEPIMTLVDYTDDEAKVRIQYDGTNLYQISTDNKANWTNVTGEIDCLDLTFTLPNSTYRGTDVWLKPQGDLCEPVESSASCHIPAPVINNPGDQNFVGTVNQPFSGTFTITGSDLYQNISAITITNNSNPAIGATINNGTITVTMAAAAVGTYTTYLTFDAVGAEDVTVKVTITIQDLAIMQITPENIIDGVYCCLDGSAPTFTFSPIYVNGTPITTAGGASNGTNTFSVIDLDDNNATINATYSVSSGAVTLTVPLANLTLTHRYQVSYTNLNDGDKTSTGLPYANASYTFTAINCNTITALPACPITNSGFTANWVPVADCTGNVTVDVYTKEEGATICDVDFENDDIPSAVSTAHSSNPTGTNTIYQYGDYTGGAWNNSYGYRIAKDKKKVNVYTQPITSAGIYDIEVVVSSAYGRTTFTIVTAQNNGTQISSLNSTEIASGATFKTITTSVTITETQLTTYSDGIKIAVIPSATDGVSGYISYFKVAQASTKTSISGYPKSVSCSDDNHDVSGLSANTTYYYTITDGSSNTSNEIAVTTYNGVPELKFYSDEACTTEITETTVLGGEETTVYVKGTRVPACAINASVSTGYGMDDSGINYTTGTGVVSGSVILTLADANTTEGTLTITDAEGNDYVLNIVSSDCPAGFGTMALPATYITNESAQANWKSTLDFGDDKSGTLHLYKNGIVNRELIVNGDFETGTLTAGWSNGLNGGDKDAVYSFSEFDIVSSNVHDEGSYCLSVTGNGSKLLAFQNMSVMYADSIILTAGTYRMSAWVKMPEASGYDDKKQSFALGLIGGKKSAVKVVCVSDITIVQSNNTYVQLTYEFTLTSTVTACPAIGANVRGETFRDFYLDDVSLMCTSIGQSDEPYLSIDIDDLSEDGFLALTGLSGNTEYTYVIQNADGCSSNSITFQTTEAGAPVIEPNDVTISCQVGNSVNGLMTLSVKDVYSDIYISNSCTERITLNTTKLPKEGGVVNFTFTPLNTDQGGETGICTISFTTKGLATPVTGIITWTVTAGKDPNQPIVEVVDITNTSMDIEHNQGNGNDVHIVISREKGEDEIEENLGEEIFFSKYYEAYMHKKLWAIYNPTNRRISLTNTYVWRSNGNSDDWNIEGGMDLSSLGNIEPGYIHPNEEIIIYTSDQVGECEQGKADMSDWVAMSSSDPALSFSGNDALLLVRKADGKNDPPTQSVELDENGKPYELSWRKYTAADDTQWWMLDIIGARKNNNTPDNSATYKWTWTCDDRTETGDADGWVGTGEHLDPTLYTCPYILSTNRCLLIRKMTVKSGYKAIQTNVNDMFTLNTEWRGVHVPLAGDQAQVSCENFSFVGGYDYDGYYNAWTPIDEMEVLGATQNDDGSYTVTPIDMPRYYCHPLRIEVYITENVNGEEIDNVKAYLDYKVPIVVDEDVTTNDTRYFVEPTRENVLSPEICAECDVVIRDAATLTHIDDGREAFRNMQVYPTAKFNIPENLSMQLEGLHMYAKNDDVGYAILNDNGSSIHADNIVHIKRIDDVYWYPFSLPYDCNVSSIYQLNGKSMGEYWVDWGIKYYNGHERQVIGNDYTAGATSDFWKKLEPDQTLKAHQGYIIGLFTTEWTGQMKSIYFPPVESTKYTENSGESKTTYISNWPENLDCEPRHRGWNFTSLPYISLFSSQNGDGTTNNNSLMMGSQADDYASSIVYVSIPDGGDSRTYTQVSAATTKLEPFKPYFVQAIDPKDGQSHNDIALTYSKGGRTLDKIQARSAASTQATIIVELVVTNADATLTDNAGVLVSERYTANYEIAADLTKMYAADRKPQLFTRAANNNEMLAYNALPDPLAQNIPLGIYLPNNDEYTISIIDYASQLSDAEAVYLLHNGEIVANLLYADYTIPTQQAGLINGYSLDIRRRQNAPTNIDNIADGGPVITVVDGQIVIQQLPEDAQLHITDVLGRVLYQQANVPQIITFQAPVTGVYNVVITTAEQQFTQKTIVR